MVDQKQREYYRLDYPESYRPLLVVDDCDYEIENISEFGLRFKIGDDPAFSVKDNIMAIITFPGGKEFDLSGQVVRVEQGCASLQLETALPLDLIKSESLHIHYHFPGQV